MPLELQSKLLRVLQDGNIRRVGATNTTKVDVRIIAATNISPEEAVENKQIRRDLYYRLNVVSFEIPLLRDRKDDIPILTNYFINKFNNKLDKNVKGVSKAVLSIFNDYKWDGNVRELEHLIEGIMSISDGEIIDIEDLPYKFRQHEKNHNEYEASLTEILEETERNIIKEVLEKTDNNITKTAELLKIPRQTLQYRLSKLGL